MRIVADTNTVVSGLLWQGPERRLMDAARDQRITIVTSHSLLAELAEVLVREKLAARIRQAGLSAKAIVEDYATIARVVVPAGMSQSVSRDPDDDEVIACALGGDADAIVSGDRDLLALGEHRGIPILKAVQALNKIAQGDVAS